MLCIEKRLSSSLIQCGLQKVSQEQRRHRIRVELNKTLDKFVVAKKVTAAALVSSIAVYLAPGANAIGEVTQNCWTCSWDGSRDNFANALW
jgi:hypothetical protein